MITNFLSPVSCLLSLSDTDRTKVLSCLRLPLAPKVQLKRNLLWARPTTIAWLWATPRELLGSDCTLQRRLTRRGLVGGGVAASFVHLELAWLINLNFNFRERGRVGEVGKG